MNKGLFYRIFALLSYSVNYDRIKDYEKTEFKGNYKFIPKLADNS